MRKLISMAAMAACLTVSAPSVRAADAPVLVPAAVPSAKKALLIRLDKAMNFEKMITDITRATTASTVDGLREIFPEMTAEKSRIITEAAESVTAKYIPQMKDATFAVYGDVLTEAELTALVEFYESPGGQAILAKLPDINQRSMARMSVMNAVMQTEMIASICEKTECPQALKDRVKP